MGMQDTGTRHASLALIGCVAEECRRRAALRAISDTRDVRPAKRTPSIVRKMDEMQDIMNDRR